MRFGIKLKKEIKQEGKNLSLSTSLNNYIDCRILWSFIKKYNIPPNKIMTTAMISKFDWAKDTDENYRF